MKSKERIIREAFILFASKPYTSVTFSDFETVTKLSRGAILYHFKSKELIFTKMIDTYIFALHTIIPSHQNESLMQYIDDFMDATLLHRKDFKKMGIKNMNKALVNITLQAQYFYPDFNSKAIDWEKQQLIQWEAIITKGIETGELAKETDSQFAAEYFQRLYYGVSYSGLVLDNGCDMDFLKKSLLEAYKLFKA